MNTQSDSQRTAGATVRHWRRAGAVCLVAAMALTALAILQVPARAVSTDAVILPTPGVSRDYMRYIVVNDYRFDPLAETPDIPASLRYDRVGANQPAYYLVQFKGPVTEAMKKGLEATGAKILHYIQYNAFIVRAYGPSISVAAQLPYVRWTGVFEPAYKLSPILDVSFDAVVQASLDAGLTGGASGNTAVTSVGSGSSPAKSLDVSSSRGSASFASGSLTAASSTGAASSPSLGAGGFAPSAARVDTSQRIRVEIVVFEKAGLAAATQLVAYLGGTGLSVSEGRFNRVAAEVPRASLASLARAPMVMFIDRAMQTYVFNDIARWVIQSGDTVNHGTPIHDHGIWGTGQVVTLGDTGIDYEHNAFEDPNNTTPGPGHRKVTDYYEGCSSNCDLNDNGINHGTHTSGSVAGDDGIWHVYDGDASGSNGTAGPHDGQAFDAKLQMQDLSNDGFYVYFDTITSLWQMAVDRDSWEHSNSWGSCCGSYDSDQADTDMFVWDNQNFTIFFAAGNPGNFLGGINPYAAAKNVVAVGATQNGVGLQNVADFSGRGPVIDGRLKPDVMAPGVSVWSARGCDPGGQCDDYFTLSGTSMATPTVAGGATLVRQYFMDGWYPTGSAVPPNAFTPSAALLKAMLINSADEMTGTGAYDNGETRYPNNNQGWGRINLDNAMFFASDARGLIVDDHRAGLGTGDFVSYDLAIGDVSEPVEVTLVWSDYPGSPGTGGLVNDLDLTVTAPSGTVYRGNQFSGYNPGESTPNPSGVDSVNNVEGVLVLSAVEAGLWNVRVDAIDVPQPSQTFAIVMTGGIATQRGIVAMDKNSYQSSATVNVKVIDTGLNLDPGSPDTTAVDMSSDTETTPEVLTLTETAASSAVFVGSILLTTGIPSPDGVLQVTNGDTITAAYFDADDGLGGSGTVFDYALVDDSPPAISAVGAINLRFNRATIVWTTDEPSDSVVTYDAFSPPGTVVSDSRRVTSHAVAVTGLTENTTYYFSVESTDEAGNTALDDNGGFFYTFTTPTRPPTAPSDPEWPTFHNNDPRLGNSPSSHLPPIDRQWADGPHLLQLWSGPVMADGMLYSTALDGSIRARDPYSGAVIWEKTLGGQYYYTAAPSVDNGVVFVTFYGPSGGRVYALDGANGNEIWSSSQLDFNARIQALATDDLVFGAAWTGEIYALNQADGTLAWTFQTGDSWPFGGATAAAGQLFMGTTAGNLFALDEFSGALIWSANLGDTVTSPPLYAQGNVYEGTYSGDMVALDAFTGAEVWRTSGIGLVDMATPAYDGASIYFGSFNSAYYALDATDGTVLWSSAISGPVGSSAAYANGFVYGTSWDSHLYTFDAFDGTIVDTESFDSFYGSVSSPAVSDGWIWAEDYEANIYGFLGQLPVGLLVSPASQAQDAAPPTTVSYAVNVKNVGISGPDVFDASITLGANGWAVDLFEADGTTPLSDSDGDTIPDTGSLATGESARVVATVTVPGTANPGDVEISFVTFTSSNDLSRSKTAKMTTTIPPPGVSVGPRAYFTPTPGDTVSATLSVANTGGFTDTIDITASSDLGWTIRLFEADGTTPLADTDGDSVPDVGAVPGLQSVDIVVEIDVPAGTPEDTVQRASITGTSSLDPLASGSNNVVIEITLPPDVDWPTFHNNLKRQGQSPSPHDPPMTEHWRTGPNTQSIWTGPVVENGVLFSTALDGSIRARNPFSGEVLWERTLGDTYYYTGTPAVTNGVVYATFYGYDGGAIGNCPSNPPFYGTCGRVFALDASDGTTLWSVGPDETGLNFNARIAMAYADGMVFGAAWGDFSTGQLYALDATDGTVLWTVNGNGLPFGGPSVGVGTVFIGTTSGQVLAVDESTGATSWAVTLDNTVTSPPLYAQGNLFVGTYSGSMYALDALSGAQMWRTSGFNLIDFSTPAYDGTSLYFGDFNYEYVSLDVGTGAINWRTSISGPVGSSVAYANGNVYGTAWDGHFRTLDAATGAIVDDDQLASFASTSMPAISRGWVWLEDFDGRVYGFGGVGAGELQEIAAVPATANVVVTTAILIGATGIDAFGNPIPVTGVDWTSVGGLGTILEISASGDLAVYVAGAMTGTDTVEISAAGLLGTATVNVLPGSLDHVAIAPGPTATVAAGGTLQFTGSSQDRFGNAIPGRTLIWGSSGGIGSISASGLLTASTTTGTGTVTASDGAKTGIVAVTVVPAALSRIDVSAPGAAAGQNSVVTATGRDQYGNAISTAPITWSSDAGSIVPLTATGLALFTAPTEAGTVNVTARSGSVTKVQTVTVDAGPLAGISAATSSVSAGLTLDLTAVDLYGNVISRTTTWSASGGNVASDGTLTAPTAAGPVTVTAQEGGLTATRTFTVTAGAIDHIDVSPGTVSLNTGGATTLTAFAEDQYGNAIDGASLTWSASIGTVSASADGTTGAFSAGERGGSGTITVTSGGKSASVSVTVTETALPPERQVSQPTSLILLVLVIALAALTAYLVVRNRSMKRAMDEEKGGGGGGSGGL